MFLHKPQLDMASLTTRLALTVAGVLLCATAQTDEPTRAPRKRVPVDDRGDKASVAKPIAPKFEMKVSNPKFRKPEPVDLPDFTYWEVKVQYKNISKEEIVLSPFVNVQVFDADGNPVEEDVFIGAGFFAEDGMAMVEKEFLVIPPGKSREVLVNLGDNRSPDRTIGWEFQKPGTYKIVVAYEHSRKAFANDYIQQRLFYTDDAIEKAKLPERLWNRAVEAKRVLEVFLTIKP